MHNYTTDAIDLLKRLIATPRVSRDETTAADILQQTMESYGYKPQRHGNNLWVISPDWDDQKPTILLNAHIDTVKPVATWTRDPFTPTIEGDRLYGLGSNDCGGGLVSLLQVFRALTSRSSSAGLQGKNPSPLTPNLSPLTSNPSPLTPNLIYLASCEEEVSGAGGIRSVLPLEPFCKATQANSTLKNSLPLTGGSGWVSIVGEPTDMQPAIAERGLMVIDGIAHGKSGHAAYTPPYVTGGARGGAVNAIYEALDDLVFIRDYKFQKESPLLGPTKMQCTVINSGTQHNVVPDECRFIIDVRTNEHYTNEEVFAFLQTKLKSELTARSFHLHSSSIPESHPLIQRCIELDMKPFGSPTLSDQALMRFPSFKLGPGNSSRSHSADEFICISEIDQAIRTYLQLLSPHSSTSPLKTFQPH